MFSLKGKRGHHMSLDFGECSVEHKSGSLSLGRQDDSMSGKAAEIAGKWQTAAAIPSYASHHGVGNNHAVTYHLSVSGVHSTDDQVFDKAYDATVFR
jgi:hypothetical protein